MKKKAPKPIRIAPLQKLSVRPIDDPTEQAALDERLKRSRIIDGNVPVSAKADEPRRRRNSGR